MPELKLVPCKFQSDASGTQVLVYSQDRSINSTATGRTAKQLANILKMPQRLGKVFATASINKKGKITIGVMLPDQGW